MNVVPESIIGRKGDETNMKKGKRLRFPFFIIVVYPGKFLF